MYTLSKSRLRRIECLRASDSLTSRTVRLAGRAPTLAAKFSYEFSQTRQGASHHSSRLEVSMPSRRERSTMPLPQFTDRCHDLSRIPAKTADTHDRNRVTSSRVSQQRGQPQSLLAWGGPPKACHCKR